MSLACASLPARAPTGAEFWGFTAPWDPRSDSSAAHHGTQLDALVSGWIALDSANFQPLQLYTDSLARRHVGNQRYMALVTSYHGTRFHPETIRAIGSDTAFLARTASAIASSVERGAYRGMILDFEGMTVEDLPALRRVVSSIADSARAHGVSPIGIAIPATDTAGYPARVMIESTDFVVAMLYDQHWLTSPPGPIASPNWARHWLGVRVGEIGAAKIVAAYPTYGYLWRPDSATAVLSYADARRMAHEANTSVDRDITSSTLHTQLAAQPPVQGNRWTAWFADAVLLDKLVSDARAIGVTKFALWRLGLEDPAIWTRVVH